MSWLTPDALEGAYNFWRELKPFKGKKMPEADDLEFRVTRHNDRYSHFEYNCGAFPNLSVSEKRVRSLDDLMGAMAHEAIHIYQWKNGSAGRSQHNQEFWRMARQICRIYNFEIKEF